MNLIEMRCQSCGASFDVDCSTHVFECTYCGTTNVIDADVVTINKHVNSGTLDLEHEYNVKMQNGEYLMNTLQNYEKAYDIFCELYENSKFDTRLLENLMISSSHNFNHKKVADFWLNFYLTYTSYLEAYSKVQKDIVKVNFYQHKLDMMQHKTMGGYNSTRLLIALFVIVAIIGIFIAVW